MVQKNGKKGKINNYFGSEFDYSSFDDDYSAQSSKTKKTENDLKGKLQRFFFRDEMHKHQIRASREDCPDGDCDGPLNVDRDYIYLQMKLIRDQFTAELEAQMDRFRKEGIQIRFAQPMDIPTLTKMYNRSFMMGSDPWSPLTEENMFKILTSSTGILIGSIQGQDVGFIITDVEIEESGFMRGIICGLGTDPSWQRRGIAKFLSVCAWDYLRKKDVDEILCEVYENNQPSYNLIKSVHFQEYGKKTYKF